MGVHQGRIVVAGSAKAAWNVEPRGAGALFHDAPQLQGARPVVPEPACPTTMPPRDKSPSAPPASSLDIDMCFHYVRGNRDGAAFEHEERIRSEPSLIGDFCAQLLVFPGGSRSTFPGTYVSVFLEAVPQPHWPADWEFDLSYKITCYPWTDCHQPISKTDQITFCKDLIDRGWHDLIPLGDINKYLNPDGFLMLRGSILLKSVPRTYLRNGSNSSAGSN